LLLLTYLMLRWFEHRQVFYPSRTLDASGGELGRPWEDVYFQASDGTKLNGWFFPADATSLRAHLAFLICHGNAGNISHRLDLCAVLLRAGVNVFVFDYRGYLVSYYQNPTGITTSFEKKAGALHLLRQFERAAGHPIYLLEDAAYREMRFRGQDVKSALAVKGARGRVVYTGTYSKPFATGARVGFGLLPEPLFKVVLHLKGNHDFGTSNLLQQLLARALASGKYAKHLNELQQRYARKARVMAHALKQHFPEEVEWQEPNGGMYFWARLPRAIKTGVNSKVFQSALARDVLYVPGALCYADDSARAKPDHEMRISFGGATESDIRTGVARLGAVLRGLMNR